MGFQYVFFEGIYQTKFVPPYGQTHLCHNYFIGLMPFIGKRVSLEMVKEFLGHKNISSTMIYARVTKSSKIRSMERLLKVLSA